MSFSAYAAYLIIHDEKKLFGEGLLYNGSRIKAELSSTSQVAESSVFIAGVPQQLLPFRGHELFAENRKTCVRGADNGILKCIVLPTRGRAG